MTYFWLNVHVGYACRHSGACCTSGWPIPVESVRAAAIENAVTRDRVPLGLERWLTPVSNAPTDVAGTIALGPGGHCVFFEARGPGCAIHHVKPAACRHFPYVCLIDQRGIHVTLSHYCPTAAAMLFEHQDAIAVVEGPPPLVEVELLEGLDARESLPPECDADTAGSRIRDPGSRRLMSFDEFAAWERDEVARAEIDMLQPDDERLFDHARSAVPLPWTWPPAPTDFEAAWWALAAPSWPGFAGVLQRYAAAKIFASWAAYDDAGLAAVRQAARVASAVLRVECARRCRQAGRALDRELLTEAIRQSDLLLVHYADPSQLFASV